MITKHDAIDALNVLLKLTFDKHIEVNPSNVKVSDDGTVLYNVYDNLQSLGIGIDEFKRKVNEKILFYSRKELTEK